MHERQAADHDHTDLSRADRDQAEGDHWEMFADAADLTIEGHRLIAEEIVYEAKLMWRTMGSWLREIIGTTLRRRSSPPV